ncbi:MAG TPA: fibronectin type III domain-containing protein [Steroidobacteraceae bacterium]|jgi:hypothetical protein|nr:fibronectin type III domain-containing protein [Steroidobacteraceae bacterium]
MRTQVFSSGISGALLAGAALASVFMTAAHATTSISGTPTTTTVADRTYTFEAAATDTDNRSITYSIKNKPSWATLNAQTGALTGYPYASNVGTFAGIVITASDGVSSASLPAFSITVEKPGSSGTTNGTATVNWQPPTQNTNGTVITNLAGYTIEYGTNKSNLTSSVKVANPGLTSYVIENLAAGTYYFGVTAYNSAGQTSSLSGVVSKTIK